MAGGEQLKAQFDEATGTVTVGYGKRAGSPVVGTPRTIRYPGEALCVKTQTLGVDAGRLRPGSSDRRQRAVNYASRRPEPRRVIGYRHDNAQVARNVRYYAHARPSLRLRRPLHNGQKVRFWVSSRAPAASAASWSSQANPPGSML